MPTSTTTTARARSDSRGRPGGRAACTHLNCEAQALIGWPAQRPPTCRVTQPVAVIDSGINPDHAGLAAAQIELARMTEEAAPESSATHGTAVLSLLVGQELRAPGWCPRRRCWRLTSSPRGRGPAGGCRLAGAGAGPGGAARGAGGEPVAGGPENSVLTDMLRAAEAAGVLVVAAAGNAGPAAPPAWPAAHDGALAVTAVDQGGRIYRKAQRGPHIDMAAPGVRSGPRPRSRG